MFFNVFISITGDFIKKHHCELSADMMAYVNKIRPTIKGDRPSRMLGNVYLLIEQQYGSGAALGFLSTLQLLREWGDTHVESDWLDKLYLLVHNVGSHRIGDFSVAYTTDPTPEMEQLSRQLFDTPLGDFIEMGEVRFSSFFSVGAYCLIAVLLYAERQGNDEEVVSLTT